MATNISFGNYSPPPPPKGTVDIRVGVFFDGTQNNRTNTNARLGKEGDKGNKAYNKLSDKDTDSYMNDFSNVARKELHYEKDQYTTSLYIEGIGTENFGEDSDNKMDHDGVAFGAGKLGIPAKVKKGCEGLAKNALKLQGKDEINTLTVDVFGFSRGAAAARNFVYELSKKNSQDVWGSQVLKYKVKYKRLQVRFVGLYDTVSSYDPDAIKNPNFDNDVTELHLNDLNLEINDLYKAKHIIHFCADDEHRKNFMLTPTRVAGGKDFYLPGVHSDVGGCYTDMMNEYKQIMDLDNTWGDGYDDDEYNEILDNDLNNLIQQGWCSESEVVRPDMWHQTYLNRKGIRNTYSFVTLHLMVEKLNTEYAGTINVESLNKYFEIPKPTKPDELDLHKVKDRLAGYINGSLPKMEYYTSKQIEILRKQEREKKITTAVFNQIVSDHNILIKLRRKYLHWNSLFGDTVGAYLPNYKISGKTIVRTRKKAKNS
ncbi:T6SS phospholipase effector Tle1-like catalytic domain-containing protein [Flavobacterium artemisiae]|uniref:T6SS phospholipase effector Tle1-like catalytic domain-containing protein n=1 Tax=Flavobacterium artemisiae TaxID=2126556 RepID=A0ABW4H784_9FLAO